MVRLMYSLEATWMLSSGITVSLMAFSPRMITNEISLMPSSSLSAIRNGYSSRLSSTKVNCNGMTKLCSIPSTPKSTFSTSNSFGMILFPVSSSNSFKWQNLLPAARTLLVRFTCLLTYLPLCWVMRLLMSEFSSFWVGKSTYIG